MLSIQKVCSCNRAAYIIRRILLVISIAGFLIIVTWGLCLAGILYLSLNQNEDFDVGFWNGYKWLVSFVFNVLSSVVAMALKGKAKKWEQIKTDFNTLKLHFKDNSLNAEVYIRLFSEKDINGNTFYSDDVRSAFPENQDLIFVIFFESGQALFLPDFHTNKYKVTCRNFKSSYTKCFGKKRYKPFDAKYKDGKIMIPFNATALNEDERESLFLFIIGALYSKQKDRVSEIHFDIKIQCKSNIGGEYANDTYNLNLSITLRAIEGITQEGKLKLDCAFE